MRMQSTFTTCAAPGCSRRLQVIVLEDRPEYIAADAAAAEKQRQEFEPLVIVNPILRPLSDDGARFFEGCLSVPGYQVRAAWPLACLLRLQELSWIVQQGGGGTVGSALGNSSAPTHAAKGGQYACAVPCDPPTACSAAAQALVERYTAVECSGFTPEGDPLSLAAHGWQARILQHEVDHLQVWAAGVFSLC